MRTSKIKLEDLVFDENLIALRKINDQIISQYRQAYQTGANMPSIVIEKKTNRIVSGNHRVKAMLKVYEPDHEISVIVKEYASEKALLLDAVKENSEHGYPLDGISRKGLACALRNQGATAEEMSSAFAIPYTKIETWFEGTADVMNVMTIGKNIHQQTMVENLPGHDSPYGTTAMPVKRHGPSGRTVTTPQYKEHMDKDLGLPLGQLAYQIVRHIKNGWVDRTPQNLTALVELKQALDGFFAEGTAQVGDEAFKAIDG